MKKMMLLAGLLVFGAMGYAKETAEFNAVVRVVKPVSVEVSRRTLDFGEVLPGATNVETTKGTDITITGKAKANVDISYTVAGQELTGRENIKLKDKVTGKTINALLYVGEDQMDLIGKRKTVSLSEYGSYKYTINGIIKAIPSDAEGNYDSGDITIKVMYQ